MAVEAKNFDYLAGTLKGLSDKQISQHIGLYKGYVAKYNEITEKLTAADRSKANFSFGEYSELKRREPTPFNALRLHELYFENLSVEGGERPSGDLLAAIERDFGSYEAWEADFKACGMTATNGWTWLVLNWTDGKLHNEFFFLHDQGVQVLVSPILVMDTWEHAFMIDYGTAKGEYMGAFLNVVCWQCAGDRYARVQRMLAAM